MTKLYRRLALKCHPDKCKHPDGPAAFRRLTAAHDSLSDPRQQKNHLGELADFHYRLFDMAVALTLFACLLCLTLLPLHSLQSMLLFNKNFWKVIVRRMDLADFLADTYQR